MNEPIESDGSAVAEPDPAPSPAHLALLPAARTWAAIHTRPRCEWKVERKLLAREVPVFLPVSTRRRTYGARIRVSRLPLFAGYLFCDSSRVDRIEVLRTDGVVRLVETRDPSRLAEELDSLARVLAVADVQVFRHEWGPPGTPVEVIAGPFAGCRGELIRIAKGTRLVLKVAFLGAGIELDLDEVFVRALEEGEQSSLQGN